MLETIRQYADEKLLEAGEKEAVHRHHLEYYMNWAEHSGPTLRGPQQVAWLKILDLELGNLRQGLSWAYQLLPEFGLRLATALYRYWRVRTLVAEGMDWLTKLVNLPENNAPTPYRARALGVLSSLGFFIAPTPEAWANESLEITERLHDEPTRAFALWMLGTIAYLRYEQLEQGRVHLFASLDAYRAINDSWGMAQVLYHLAP